MYRNLLAEDNDQPGVLYFGGTRMVLLDVEASFGGLRRQLEALIGQRLSAAVLQQAGVNARSGVPHTALQSHLAGICRPLCPALGSTPTARRILFRSSARHRTNSWAPVGTRAGRRDYPSGSRASGSGRGRDLL